VVHLFCAAAVSDDPELATECNRLRACLAGHVTRYTIELHAGVYPILDMQQLATKSSPSSTSTGTANKEKSVSDIALTILAEVASVYPHRSPPEALLAAGSLALGREPCKSYAGWGVVTDWNIASEAEGGDRASGWTVARISQEHGILQAGEGARGLVVGQRVRIWPNHACIAGAGFRYYLVVDSAVGSGDEVVDVWGRCWGW
jgi:D-serine deaminase-like pyridoxal phosphate-dependent protein